MRARAGAPARRLRLRPGQEGLGQAAGRDDDGVRPAAQGPHARQGVRPADRADHPRRGAHLRDGQLLLDDQDLQPARPELHAGRRRAHARLPRGQGRPDPPPRHQRGRLGRRVHRCRVELRHARPADDPHLRLLLDVRVPAHGRLDLGRRRPDDARLPHRGDRRSHDAHRRGAAARRRPLAAARVDQPGCRALRPGVRVRDRAHHAGRPAPDVRHRRLAHRRPAQRHLLPHRLQRADGPAGRARGRRPRRASCAGMYLYAEGSTRRPARRRTAGAAARVRCRDAVGARGAGAAAQRLERRRRRVVGDVVERAAPRRAAVRRRPPSSTRRPRPPCRGSPRSSPDRPGPVVAVSDYMRAVQDQIRQWVPARLRVARRRRVRVLRHPPRCPALLPHRRSVDGRAGAAVARRARRGRPAPCPLEAARRYRLSDVTAGASGNEGGDSG